MKKVINGIVYDHNGAANLCYVTETKKVGIDGVEASLEFRKTLMRMRRPKAGVLPHEVIVKSSFDPNWLVVDNDKLEDTGEFFFTLAVGRYGGNVIAIVPATADEARRFMEEHVEYDEYVKHFGCPDGFDVDDAKKTAKAINDANDARDAAKKDLEAKTEELARMSTELVVADGITGKRDAKISELCAANDALVAKLDTRNDEISALNEEISRLNDELDALHVVKEPPAPEAHEPDGEEGLE